MKSPMNELYDETLCHSVLKRLDMWQTLLCF